MKRLFTTILALSLSLILLILSGCMGATPLTFNNSFNAANEPNSSYRETLTYAVTHGDHEDITRSGLIKNEDLSFTITGEYKTAFESVTKSDLPDTAKQTDIDLSAGTGNIYHLSSKLTLNVNYKVNGEGSGDYVDTIESDVYFLPSGMSFAPIYSNVKQNTSILSAENTDSTTIYNVTKIENQISILYNKGSYKTTISSGENSLEQESDYTFKTVIDNAELLFALRNLSVEKDSSTSISAVSSSYSEPKSLLIANVSEFESTLNLLINGTSVNEKLDVKKLKFNLNENKNTGIPQFVTIQKTTSNNIPAKALMTEYACATMCYGTNVITGALIYKLVSAEFNA